MERLIVFTRYPEPGQTKTRLIPALGAEGSAQLHRQMAEKTIKTAQQFAQLRSVALEVCYTGSNLRLMQAWLGQALIYVQQGSGDLGDRLTLAFQKGFVEGNSAVIAIGTDCPDLTSEILTKACEGLQLHDVVLGPAKDGGYYLVGMQRFIPELFQGIPWGTAAVFQQTTKICQGLRLGVSYLPELTDIDRPEDLKNLGNTFLTTPS
ncbi:MAG: TIGR04282 family arsenosugar biosynthesis glycosyltransferase [Microcoleaceae cyanobacterium]